VAGPRPLRNPAKVVIVRCAFDELIYSFGYPAKGGMALENPTIPGFDFLSLDRFDSQPTRYLRQRDEDDFKRLLLLGAK
jgi:hypothetical protein